MLSTGGTGRSSQHVRWRGTKLSALSLPEDRSMNNRSAGDEQCVCEQKIVGMMTVVTVRYFVMMHGRIPLLLLIILSIGLAGCRKEKDDRGPVIEIATPAGTTTLHVPDTLAVIVTVSDDEMVTSVRITLEDHNGIPIAPTIIEDVNAPGATLQREIIVSQTLIEAGSYSLAVRASDGKTTTSAFRSVNVLEADRRLRAIFIVQQNGGSLQRIDSQAARLSRSQEDIGLRRSV